MFIPADVFLKVGVWDFNHPTDISYFNGVNNPACATFGPDGSCNACPLLISAGTDRLCATVFSENPDLQASIDAFKFSHPEYFL